MRAALTRLHRYIATPTVAKHRLFVWLSTETLPDHQLIAVARDDDWAFGVLHSCVHESWARRKGTQLREYDSGFRYTPTSTFETFPFPAASTPIRQRVADAAAELHRLREGWLTPSDATAAILKKRTLTNLYNARPAWLENVHLDLDRAVLAAYGWPEEWAEGLQPLRDENGKVNPALGVQYPEVEQELLGRLLALNLKRAEG